MYGVFAFGRTGIPAEAISRRQSIQAVTCLWLEMRSLCLTVFSWACIRQLTPNRLQAQEKVIGGPRVPTSGGQATCTFIGMVLAAGCQLVIF